MKRYIRNSTLPKREDSSVNLKELFTRVLRDWWVIALSLIICNLMVFGFLTYKTPVYKINAKLMVQDDKKGSGIDAGKLFEDISGLLNSKNNVDNEAEILKARTLMEQVVRNMNLNVVFFQTKYFKKVEVDGIPLSVKMKYTNDSVRATAFKININAGDSTFSLSHVTELDKTEITNSYGFGETIDVPGVGIFEIEKKSNLFKGREFYFEIKSIDEQVDALRDYLKVAVTSKLVTTIDLQFDYSLPQKGERILSEIINVYMQQNLQDKNRIADSTINFIENRLVLVGKELGGIESNIQSFKQVNKLADISEQSKILVSNINEYTTKTSELGIQIKIANELEAYLKDSQKNKRVVPASVLPQDVVFNKLVENYNSLLMEKDKQMLTSTEENPYIKNIDERIIGLRSLMLANLSETKKALEIKLRDVQQELKYIDKDINEVPAQERIYLDLARQQQIKQELYLFLLQKREEIAISKTSTISNSKIIDFPKSDFKPFSPNNKMYIMLGLLASFIIPFVRIYLLDIFNTRVQTKEEITDAVDIPVIGEISHNESETSLVVHADPRSIIAEQFRGLRTNLQFFLSRKKGNVIMITSSMSGEGKSFTTLNLGTILAISGKKVLMMELDLRKPNLSPDLHINADLGFTNYIFSREIKVNDIITQTNVHENLSIISSGPLPPNPAETIMNERMNDLMEELKEMYDYIIIDVPPIGLVTDAQLLAQYTNLTLYVVRQKYTYKEQLAIVKDLHANNKMQKMGIVINDIRRNNGAQYGYSYGYVNENKKWSFSNFKEKALSLNNFL